MENIFILILIFLFIDFLIILLRPHLFATTYITKVIIDRPYEIVWKWLADLNTYAKLYPKWIRTISPVAGDEFLVTSPHMAESYRIKAHANEEWGVIDVHFSNRKEVSRTRILRLSENQTAVIHLGTKWEGFNWFLWIIYQFNVDSDFMNAKQFIETWN
jgi:hypothetical protein